MSFFKTLAVFMCVILASLAFVAQDALAARSLAQTSDNSYGGGWPGDGYPTLPSP